MLSLNLGTHEHDKLIQMGIIRSSRDQALVAGGCKVANDKQKKKDDLIIFAKIYTFEC